MNTSFDLDLSIRRWRNALAQSPALQGEDLDELESHLRDAVRELHARGLSEEEAALVAARRLGCAETLMCEFGKVNIALVWRDRALWMLAGILFFIVGWDLSHMTASAIMYFGSLAEMTGFSLGWFGVVAKSVTLGLVAVLFWLTVRGRVLRWNTAAIWVCQHPVICAAVLLGVVVALKIASSAFEMLMIRSVGPQVIGQTYAVTMWFNAFIPVLAAAVMIVLFTRLLSGRAKATGGFGVAAWILVPVMAMSFLSSPARAQAGSNSAMSAAGVVAEEKDLATLDQALTLWRAGKKDEAAARFLAVDFTKRPLFPSGSVLNYTEKQFMALPRTAAEKLSKQMLEDISGLKGLCTQVKDTGRSALNQGDKAMAEKCTAQLKACGNALDHPDSLALLKLVGKAIQKMAAEPATPPKN